MGKTWPFDYPKLPDVESRVRFIWRQFVDPCDAPITVWLQNIGPALGHALIAWYAVDLIQIVRTIFTPPLYGYRIRSGRHRSGSPRSRGKGFRSKLGKIIGFDVNEWVGSKLSAFGDEYMVLLSPGEIWFWSASELLITAAFYWSIIDIGSGFLYEWISAVSASKYCQARDDAVLLADAPGYPLIGIFGWDAVGILNVQKQRNIDFFNGFGVEQNVGPGVVSVSFSYLNVGGGDGEPWIETRLRCLTGPRAGTYSTRRVGAGFHASGSAGTTYDMMPGEVWIGEIRVNGGWNIIKPTLWCHARA